MIIPSIDLMEGKAVQLRQGKEKVLEREDVIELAKDFSRYGELAVVDLDAAMSKGSNEELIKQVCKVADCRVGGGIRSVEKVDEYLSAGAKKVIIGTKASPDFLRRLPKSRVIVAVDSKDGMVASEGWTKSTGKKAEEMVQELEPYCSEFLFTNVNREGMMQGPDLAMAEKLRSLTKNELTVAGGISTLQEVKKLEDLGVNSQLGMALYTGKIRLDEAFVSLLDFSKNSGMVPTIVQDIKGQVLMLAFSSKKSLLTALKTGKGTYYSRSRSKVWTKGETSGNYQKIVKVRYDCDRDALLFVVEQKNVACHSSKYSCFGSEEFGLQKLYSVIKDRLDNPKAGSYTSEIGGSEASIKAKIREEIEEVLQYKNKGNLIWEIADLAYFVMILMARNGITLADVRNELWRRSK